MTAQGKETESLFQVKSYPISYHWSLSIIPDVIMG